MLTSNDNMQLLKDAVGRNAAIVLSLPSAGMVRNHKTRFLGDDEQGFWVEIVSGSAPLLKELKETGHPLAVSFNIGSRRVSFATNVLVLNSAFVINAETSVPAVLIARPRELKGVQRRSAYRVRVTPDCDLRARAWIIPEHAVVQDQPQASQEIKIELCDLSAGGIGIRVVPNPARPITLVADQRLRVELKYKELELLLDGRLRTAIKASEEPSKVTGVVFKKLEGDLEGRQKMAALTRIVGDLQRDEVRRMRLGVAS